MVKGRTRRIVEIRDTGSNCFERAIFFVKADTPKGTSEDTLTKEAEHVIDRFRAELIPEKRSAKRRAADILRLALAAAAGAGCCAVILVLMSVVR